MDPYTPITPLEPGVEMFTRGRPQSLFAVTVRDLHTPSILLQLPSANPPPNKQRPVSEVTEIYDYDHDDDDDDDDHDDASESESADESQFEEDSDDARSFDWNEQRISQSTISTFDEVQTPRSSRRAPFSSVAARRSVEGPRGPHLFRSSSASSEFTFDYALQLSPIHTDFPQPQKQHQTIDQALQPPTPYSSDTPTTAITETAYTVPSAGKRWQSEDPKAWSAQQVTIWMQDSGIESDFIDRFAFHDINGAILLDLQFDDLKELGIQSFGKRHQVWNHLCTLRNGNGRVSPSQPPPEANPHKTLTTSGSRRNNDHCDDMTPITPAAGQRRRRKYRQNGHEPITPADSVSIVAIEQLIPKPHKCPKGENCQKWKKQQRLLRKLHEEHGLPISPENGGRIFMAGNPGNPSSAPKLVQNVQQAGADMRPTSEANSSLVGPSVVASSDLLGPGEMPAFALDADRLKQVVERDPQDYVKNFLALQHLDPPADMLPVFEDLASEHPQMKAPENTPGPLTNLQSLPRLQIPISNNSTQNIQPFSAVPISAATDVFSPCRSATTSPVGASLYRFGTPASEMDVAVTEIPLGPVARENSQSVPPSMHYRDPINRASSRVADWRRPSFQMPPLAEAEESAPLHGRIGSASTASFSTITSSMKDGTGGSSNNLQAVSSRTSNSEVYDPRYPNVNHSGWMKKRKTKLLRHEWNEHHFRLNNNAQLTMHRNDLPTSSPLDSLNIDEYAVACSSIASGKLSAKLKAMKIQNDASATAKRDEAFSFQLVPTRPDGDETGKLRKVVEGKKTHHFAVKTRDERIDWMRELMLAKALRDKEGEGYEVEHNRGD